MTMFQVGSLGRGEVAFMAPPEAVDPSDLLNAPRKPMVLSPLMAQFVRESDPIDEWLLEDDKQP